MRAAGHGLSNNETKVQCFDASRVSREIERERERETI